MYARPYAALGNLASGGVVTKISVNTHFGDYAEMKPKKKSTKMADRKRSIDQLLEDICKVLVERAKGLRCCRYRVCPDML